MKQIHEKEYEGLIDLMDSLKELSDQYNAQVEKIKEILEPELDRLNELREEIERSVESIEEDSSSLSQDMDEYQEGRSSSWQESEEGEEYQEWTEAWANLSSELPDVPTEVSVEDLDLEEVEVEDGILPPRNSGI